MMPSLPSRRSAALYVAVLGVLAYSWMWSAVSVPNERSRIYLAVAVVDQHTLSIDGPVSRFGTLYDWAVRDGRHYTDKAPGSSLLAAVVYGTARLFSPPEGWSIARLINLMRTTVMLPLGLLGFFALRRLLDLVQVGRLARDWVSLTWILGSTAFHMSTAFLGHQIVAVSLMGSLGLLLASERTLYQLRLPPRQGWSLPPPRHDLPGFALRRLAAAGGLAGFAVFTEYQSAFPLLFLGLFVLLGPVRRHVAGLLAFILGAVPFVIGLLLYNKLAFGGPFELSYHHLVDTKLQEMHGRGVGGVAAPSWAYAWGGLVSLHRGLFSTSPLFLLAFPGLLFAWQRSRRLALLLGATWLYYLLFISSTEVWAAGWGYGPRLLVPMMGWGMVLVGLAVDRFIAWQSGAAVALGLGLWGVLCHQLVHVVCPEIPERMTNPLLDLVLPALREGLLAPNLLTRWGVAPGLFTLLPLLVLLLTLAVLVVRPILVRWSGADRRAVVLLAAAGILVPLLLFVGLSGVSQPPDGTRAFLAWMRRMQATEASERK